MSANFTSLIDLSIDVCNGVQGLIKTTPDTYFEEFVKERKVDNQASVDFLREVLFGVLRYQKLLTRLVDGFLGTSSSLMMTVMSSLLHVSSSSVRDTYLNFSCSAHSVKLCIPFCDICLVVAFAHAALLYLPHFTFEHR